MLLGFSFTKYPLLFLVAWLWTLTDKFNPTFLTMSTNTVLLNFWTPWLLLNLTFHTNFYSKSEVRSETKTVCQILVGISWNVRDDQLVCSWTCRVHISFWSWSQVLFLRCSKFSLPINLSLSNDLYSVLCFYFSNYISFRF